MFRHYGRRSRAQKVSERARHAILAAPYPFRSIFVNMTISLAPLVALIAGVLILAMPRLLNYIVALYLIIIGVLGLFGGKL